jgi:hypothetical protein
MGHCQFLLVETQERGQATPPSWKIRVSNQDLDAQPMNTTLSPQLEQIIRMLIERLIGLPLTVKPV